MTTKFDCEVEKMTKGKNVYYTVAWSKLKKADKYDIIKCVPAMGGIAELYFMDSYGKLNLFCVTRSWYGGLRSNLRELTDPILEKDPKRKAILEAHEKEIYYRYALLESMDDMNDILYFFIQTYSPGSTQYRPSGRYENIFVKEVDPDKIVSI